MHSVQRLFTIGHSTRTSEALIDLLREHAIALLVDVRRFPASRRHPQFGKDALRSSLSASGIEYRHEVDLGGMREPLPASPNTAWKEDAFRGYADHAQSDAFAAALARVLEEASVRPTSIMCAEADPSHCHRRVLSDVVVARGWRVVHILEQARAEDHELDSKAFPMPGGKLIYPAPRQHDLGFDS